MMFTYWSPYVPLPLPHQFLQLHPSSRCALSLGDLPTHSAADPFCFLPCCPAGGGHGHFAPHTFPLRTPPRRRKEPVQSSPTKCCQKDASTSTTILTDPAAAAAEPLLAVSHHSVGTQTVDGPNGKGMAPKEWLQEIDDQRAEEEEEEDEELAVLCADIAQCLMAMTDRWAASKKCGKKEQREGERINNSKEKGQNGNGGGFLGWLRRLLFVQ